MATLHSLDGCGIGLRRCFLDDFLELKQVPDWLEIVPENWICHQNKYSKAFEKIISGSEVVCHGLSLSIGSPEPADKRFLTEIKSFLDRYDIKYYSDHLSFSSLNGVQSYELLPVPMTEDMLTFLISKIQKIQDFLKRELILENPTYYFRPYAEMSESYFMNSLMKRSGAKLLFDVNNVYVNSKNHNFNPTDFVDEIDLDNVRYYHMAGHFYYKKDFIIDTHGEMIVDEVFDLLEYVLSKKIAPILLERDTNIPHLRDLMIEYKSLKSIYNKYAFRKKTA